MDPEKLGYWIGMVVGGVTAGAACGLIPFGLGKYKGRLPFRIVSLVTCMLLGVAGGVIFAGPAALILGAIVLILGKADTGPSSLQGRDGLSSEGLAALVVDALVDAQIVEKTELERAIKIATVEINVRKAAGDY